MEEWNRLDKFIALLRYKKLMSFIPDRMDTICDIGCGKDGRFLKSISERISKGYALDRKIENHTEQNIEFIKVMDIQQGLPLEDESVDVICMIAVLEHLDEPEAIFCEAYRVLKSKGKFILTSPSKMAKPILEFMAFKLKIISANEIKDHKYYYCKTEVNELFKKNKFTNMRFKWFQFGMNQIFIGEK